MSSNRQIFINDSSTPRTHLASVFGINYDYISTSIFCFVHNVVNKSLPSNIHNGLVQILRHYLGFIFNTIFKHGCGIKFFKTNCIIFFNKLKAFFVGKISSFVCQLFINMRDYLFLFFSFIASFFKIRQFLLSYCYSFCKFFKKSWISNFSFIRHCSKNFNAQVNTHRFFKINWNSKLFSNIAIKANIPFICGTFNNGTGFNNSLNRSMKSNFNRANFRKPNKIFFFNEFPPALGKCERVISTSPFKAWKSYLSLLRFDSSKKAHICRVNSFKNLLQYLRMNFHQIWIDFFLGFKKIGRANVGNILFFFFVRFFSACKVIVIKTPARFKRLLQNSCLRFTWIDSVFKTFSHIAVQLDYDILRIIQLNVKKSSLVQKIIQIPRDLDFFLRNYIKMFIRAIFLIGILSAFGCRSKETIIKRYFEPTSENKVIIKDEGGNPIEIRGALKEEISQEEQGANEFSPGKQFHLNIEGISL